MESRLATEIESNKAMNLAKDPQVLRYKATNIALEASCIRFCNGVWQCFVLFVANPTFFAKSSTCPDQLERDKLMKNMGGGGSSSASAGGGRKRAAKKSAAKPPEPLEEEADE